MTGPDPASLIRSIGRGLEVLRIVSLHGPMNLKQITRVSKLPYPTVARIAATLQAERYLEREYDSKRYRVTELVQSISHGFQNDSRMVKVARPYLVEMTQSLDWPVLIATQLGDSMVVRDSTHSLTSLTLHHYFPGFTFPMIDSAAGRAYLAFCSDEKRDHNFKVLETMRGDDMSHAINLAQDTKDFDAIRKAGFATRERNSFTSPPGKNSSIAVPIFDGTKICGAIALVFFAAAMSMDEAIKRYSEKIMETAENIGDDMTATSIPSSK